MKTAEWQWTLSDQNGGADGSSLSKLFRGGALSDTALLAREALQNSTDAARAFAAKHPEASFRVVFRFEHLYGEEKEVAVEALDLRRLAERRAAYAKDPLQPGNALDSLDDPKVALALLYVEDYATHGLSGSINIGKRSHLFKAMYYIGASDKAADSGGSYGFGKSALLRASRTQSVIAHSAFEPLGTDPVTSRLVGFTWWPDLQEGDQLWNGRLSFSDHHEQGAGMHVATPFEDERANQVAESLGFRPRDPNDVNELGSSFLIIDPAVDPDALVREIERWWWPALEEHRLDVEIVLPSGEVKIPKPATNPFVTQFLRAFRIATRLDLPGDANSERLASEEWRDRSGFGGKDLGALALVVADPSMDEQVDEFDPGPLVALVRGPRMVISYLEFQRRRVPLRGVFIASEKIDGLLRDTEPSSHDRWTDNDSGDLPAEATETARTVLRKIKDSVRRMANDITPSPPKSNRSLAHFARLMSGFLGDKRGPSSPPKSAGEKIELHFPDGRPTPEVVTDDDVRLTTKFSVGVADDAPADQCDVSIGCALYIHEDGSQSQSTWPVRVRPVETGTGFTETDNGEWSGTISRGTKIVFEVDSDTYPNLWTVSLQPVVTRIGEWV